MTEAGAAYTGRTLPSSVGWTRIGITVLCGVILAVLMLQRGSTWAAIAALVVFALLALWTWMGQATTFTVDSRGVTFRLGGFFARKSWPLAEFRTVQLRELPRSTVGVTLGGYGWRRGRASTPKPAELTPVGRRKIFTLDQVQQPYRMVVTREGTMVEIIGREGTNWIFSPEDPQAAADAVDQVMRARR